MLKAMTCAVMLVVAGAGLAAETKPPAKAAGGADKNGAWCTTPATAECGLCSVSCAVGQAAVCEPGEPTESNVIRSTTRCQKPPACGCSGPRRAAAE